MTKAVLFDVDFTLIYPGPTFQGEGYQRFCARHGLAVDPRRFEEAVASSSPLLDRTIDHVHDTAHYLAYVEAIIRRMGGEGPGVAPCAAEIYHEWAVNHHFSLYDDVPETLRALASRGLRLGLVSNTHRCLTSFQAHFDLDAYISAAVSSSEHGYMKPHPSIFRTAVRLLGVEPAATVMVGDNLRQDIEGAVAAGLRAVHLCRRSCVGRDSIDVAGTGGTVVVPVISTLADLPALVEARG